MPEVDRLRGLAGNGALGRVGLAVPASRSPAAVRAQRLAGRVEGGMAFLGLIWRLVRRRWVRRMLFWIAARLIRWFGLRRTVRLLFRDRSRWRVLAVAVWRATGLLLRAARSVLMLAGWRGARSALSSYRTSDALSSAAAPRRRRLPETGMRSSWQLGHDLRANLPSRVARHRDGIRRSVLAALGIDPNWRPPSRRAIGPPGAADRKRRPVLHENSLR